MQTFLNNVVKLRPDVNTHGSLHFAKQNLSVRPMATRIPFLQIIHIIVCSTHCGNVLQAECVHVSFLVRAGVWRGCLAAGPAPATLSLDYGGGMNIHKVAHSTEHIYTEKCTAQNTSIQRSAQQKAREKV